MVRKIFRLGSSLVVSLPKDILDMLGLDEGAEVSVEIEREQRRIIITPAGLALPGVNEEFAR